MTCVEDAQGLVLMTEWDDIVDADFAGNCRFDQTALALIRWQEMPRIPANCMKMASPTNGLDGELAAAFPRKS